MQNLHDDLMTSGMAAGDQPIAPLTPPVWARSINRWSRITQAAIASATGTARMPTQGSCRPLVIRSISCPWRSMVRRGVVIEEVGLTEKRTKKEAKNGRRLR